MKSKAKMLSLQSPGKSLTGEKHTPLSLECVSCVQEKPTIFFYTPPLQILIREVRYSLPAGTKSPNSCSVKGPRKTNPLGLSEQDQSEASNMKLVVIVSLKRADYLSVRNLK